MTPEEISNTLKELFGDSVETPAATSWQVETPKFRLLVLLSEDGTWLRILLPIGDAQEAQPFFDKLLEANFDTTLETRYAIHQNVLWGVFQHSLCHTRRLRFLGRRRQTAGFARARFVRLFRRFDRKPHPSNHQSCEDAGTVCRNYPSDFRPFLRRGIDG
jgi:hypothetical protein